MRLEPEERRNYVHSQLDGYGRLYMSCLELFVQKLWCKQRLLLRTNRIYEEKLSTISEIIGSPKSNEVLNATKNDCEKLENIIQKMHRIIFIPPHKESDLHIVNDLLCREAEDTLWEYEEEEDILPSAPSSNHHSHLHRSFTNCVTSSAVYKDPSTSREPSSRVMNATVKKQQNQQMQRREVEAKNNGHCFSSPPNSSPARRNTDNTSTSTSSTIDGRRVSNVSDGESPLPVRENRRSSKRANGGGGGGGTNGSIQKKSRNNRTKDDKEIVKCCAQKGCEYIERDNANNMRKHYRNWHDNIDYPPAPYVKREMGTEMVNQYLHNWMVQRKKRQPARSRELGGRPSTDSWPGLSIDGMLVYPDDVEEDEDYEINVLVQPNYVKDEKTQENTASSTTQNN